MFDLKAYLAERAGRVNAALSDLLPPADESRLAAAMRHSLMAGGKRVRPALCLAAADAIGAADAVGARDAIGAGDASAHILTAACAIEMIHTYSLIHDDLPAMDDDALRRGRPTCHVAFDEATAILAGDALLTLAFETLAGIDPPGGDPARLLRVIRNIARAAGPAGMIEGQMRDMAAEGLRLDRLDLERLHCLKTGALIRAAVTTGAVLAGGDAGRVERLGRYADAIGLAFQVADDLLNVTGDPAVIGKAVGTDSARAKNTYPSLMGLDGARRFANDLAGDAVAALDGFGGQADPLRAIARYVVERNR